MTILENIAKRTAGLDKKRLGGKKSASLNIKLAK
jgi:hypothetical protein